MFIQKGATDDKDSLGFCRCKFFVLATWGSLDTFEMIPDDVWKREAMRVLSLKLLENRFKHTVRDSIHNFLKI